jgi:hypothetical protein
MLGFDAPLTIETKDVLGRPKGRRAACQRDRDRHCPSSRPATIATLRHMKTKNFIF